MATVTSEAALFELINHFRRAELQKGIPSFRWRTMDTPPWHAFLNPFFAQLLMCSSCVVVSKFSTTTWANDISGTAVIVIWLLI
jgi:hypothetical protein